MRANQALIVTIVSNGATCRGNAGAQRRFRDNAALPDDIDQLFLADNSIAMTNEMNQQIEYLGLDRDEFAFSPQFVLREVNLEVGEAEIQGLPRLRGGSWPQWRRNCSPCMGLAPGMNKYSTPMNSPEIL